MVAADPGAVGQRPDRDRAPGGLQAPGGVVDELEAARRCRDEPRSQLVLEDRQDLAGRRGTGDPIAQPVHRASPQRVDRQPSVPQFASTARPRTRNAPRLEVHPDYTHRRLVLDDVTPAPHTHEPAIGEHRWWHRGIGVVQAMGVAILIIRWPMASGGTFSRRWRGSAAQAVDIVDESVERRSRRAADVFHSLIMADEGSFRDEIERRLRVVRSPVLTFNGERTIPRPTVEVRLKE